MNKYIIVPYSVSGHCCCFTHSILTLIDPDINSDKDFIVTYDGFKYKVIAESFDEESAYLVTKLLNTQSNKK